MTKTRSTASLSPSFGELPFFCPQLKGMVTIGMFVYCNGKIHRTTRRKKSTDVANNTTKKEKITTVQYRPIDESSITQRAVLEASLSTFNELVQDCQPTTILASDIVEIAFVFHEKTLESIMLPTEYAWHSSLGSQKTTSQSMQTHSIASLI